MKQNNEALPGVVMGGGGTDGDGPGGEHYRLPEGPSGPQSGEQLLAFDEDKDVAVNNQRGYTYNQPTKDKADLSNEKNHNHLAPHTSSNL